MTLPRQTSDSSVNNDMIIGEMRGQLRELVHSVNGLSTKFDALTREVIALGPLAVQIAEIKADVQKLKEAHQQSIGGRNLAMWFIQSPLFAWIAAALVLFITWWRGGTFK